MPRLACTAVSLVILSSCGGDEGPRVVLSGDDGETVVNVEIADSPEERERGLMGRRELDPEAGMVFAYPAGSSGPFWMKNTLIPLSIAFYGTDGRILRILDMEPCREDPCPLYDPGVTYRGALEVNRGAFRRWGIGVGDNLRVED
jgi:uncharacterized membrane protein (UPF0127 family)